MSETSDFKLDLYEVGPLKNSWEGAIDRLATTQMYLLVGCGWKGEMQGWTPPANVRVYKSRWVRGETVYLPVQRYPREEACRYAAEAIEIQQEEAKVARAARDAARRAAEAENDSGSLR